MEKNPVECKNSMRLGDTYICKIQTIPCYALGECALATVNSMVDAMGSLLAMRKEPPKEDER